MFKVSLVIPTYNEVKSLPFLVEEIFSAIDKNKIDLEIIIVDDNSPDGTGQVAEDLKKKFSIRVIHRQGKLGLGTAVAEGFNFSDRQYLGVMDGDLSHDPKILNDLIFSLEKNDIAIGSRFSQGSSVENWRWWRRVVSNVGVFFASKLTKVRDPLSGYFFINRNVIEKLLLKTKGYKILLEILVKGKYDSVYEVPFNFRMRKFSTSKLNYQEYLLFFAQLVGYSFFKIFNRKSSKILRSEKVSPNRANYVLLIIAVLFSLLTVEFVLRMFEDRDLYLTGEGYMTLKPFSSKTVVDLESGVTVNVVVNKDGFRGRDAEIIKPTSTLRIAMLGDSFTIGAQYNYDKTFPYLLEEKLKYFLASSSLAYKKVEILNFGFGGIGTAEEMLYYAKFVQKYKPDIVALDFFFGNDFGDNYYYFNQKKSLLSGIDNWKNVSWNRGMQKGFWGGLRYYLFNKSAIVRLMYKFTVGNGFISRVSSYFGLHKPVIDLKAKDIPELYNYYLEPLDKTRAESITYSADLVNTLYKQVIEDGSEFVLVVIPEGISVNKKLLVDFKNKHNDINFNPDYTFSVFIGGLNKDIRYVDLRKVFTDSINKNHQVYIKDKGHFTEYGHMETANEIFNFLVNKIFPVFKYDKV